MDIAALVISVISLLATGAGVVYFKRQADAAGAVAGIEGARHHEERTPKLEAEIETVNDGGWFRLWLRLPSGPALDSVRVELEAESGISFGSGQEGVEPGTVDSHEAVSPGTGLRSGGRIAWRVMLPEERPKSLRVNVEVFIGAERWDVPLVVDVPYDIAKSVW